ncbi:hypothetical protein B0H67DRAFT_654317 [Lasiosphaeris hirsuta]|uniref:Uncharacterized protein n=1 Tax=Lasiosphaeris hirsuta TaxID=260670 RepID=A0AA40BCQ6_9PEZI|nr:hypothetical protein B0H67DRAFT_654317 [Lasiosphaeris hirsuta]
MEGVSSLPGDLYKAEVDRTLKELNNMKKEIEDALKQVEASSRDPDVNLTATDSMAIMTKAYEEAAKSEPFLPYPGSILPALLALRQTQQTTAESKDYVKAQADALEHTNKRIQQEEAQVREQRALQAALQKRLKSLQEGLETQDEKTTEEVTREHAAKLKQQKADFDQRTSAVMKQLDWFIENHLGPMLAAEELGGPIVGELTEIEPDELSAGFSAQGKLKKAKENPNQDKRQRRIDDIWGGVDGQDQQGSRGKRKREGDEASAAGAEMRDLTEQLLNRATESGGDSSAAYVRIARESAAARFLVRSKVAEFHPKDAKRLRLVDFGRELDD